MGESKPRLPGDTPEIPVVLVVVLVVVSAMGSDFGFPCDAASSLKTVVFQRNSHTRNPL